MSSYMSNAENPKTGKVEIATFIDDYYGRHKYGVKFEDGGVYPEDKVKVPEGMVTNNKDRAIEEIVDEHYEAMFTELVEDTHNCGDALYDLVVEVTISVDGKTIRRSWKDREKMLGEEQNDSKKT